MSDLPAEQLRQREPAEIASVSTQLESPDLRDRMVALASLRDFPADVALPLIKKVLNDESLQLRSMQYLHWGSKLHQNLTRF
jgi:HEAT repeat protein